jgi:2'-5' RNA ligase
MQQKRIQLTLFLDPDISETIEQIRQLYNPAQYALIKSHVTLCREDELNNIHQVLFQLENAPLDALVIDFGAVVRFSEGKGVLIPAIGGLDRFQEMRQQILQGSIDKPRIQEPHITLIHPRNGTCTDEIFENIRQIPVPNRIVFNNICLIEQVIGEKWFVLKEFSLLKSSIK